MKNSNIKSIRVFVFISTIVLLAIQGMVSWNPMGTCLTMAQVTMVHCFVVFLVYGVLKEIHRYRKEHGYTFKIQGWFLETKIENELLCYEAFVFVVAIFTYTGISVRFLEALESANVLPTLIVGGVVVLVTGILVRYGKNYEKILSGTAAILCVAVVVCGSIAEYVYVQNQAWNACREKSVFLFKDEESFERCKSLYEKHEDAYVVLSSGNNTAEVRELTNDHITVYYTESEQDFKKFIEEKTMGLGEYVPELVGDVVFEKGDRTVSYETVFGEEEVIKEMKESYKQSHMIFFLAELFVVVGILGVARNRGLK